MTDEWREREQLGEMVEYRRAGEVADGELGHESWGDRMIVRGRDGWVWTYYENGITCGSHPVEMPGRRPQPHQQVESLGDRLSEPFWKTIWREICRLWRRDE